VGYSDVIEMRRLKSGMKGLDDALEGGFPYPSVILVAGEPGSGKTTLSIQTLFHGAKKGEKGLYVSAISEPQDQVHRYMANYGFYDRAVLDRGLIKFLDVGEILLREGPENALEMIVNISLKEGVNRVVIDPIEPFSYMFEDHQEYRRFLYEFFVTLKSLETLTLICAESSPRDITKTENYMADGVIFLYLQNIDNPLIFKPGIQIRKMKGTEHTKDVLRVGFTKDGMRIL
jgi:circadian clock protein KaiC